MRVTNGEVSLHVSEDGDPAAPAVLLLHGIIGSKATWSWLVPELAQRFRVLRLDFRGHGDSDRAPGGYTPEGYAGDAIAALEQAAGRPCIVIGHSLGAVTAARGSQLRPHLPSAAGAGAPPLGPTTPGEPLSLEGNSLLDAFRFMREAIPQLQGAGMSVDALCDVIAATPGTSGD